MVVFFTAEEGVPGLEKRSAIREPQCAIGNSQLENGKSS
jgi:hypothetical protein